MSEISITTINYNSTTITSSVEANVIVGEDTIITLYSDSTTGTIIIILSGVV